VDTELKPITPDCSSSNCEFPEFNTLGICVKTANITDKLMVKKEPNANWTTVYSDSGSDEFFESLTTTYSAKLTDTGCEMVTPWSYVVLTCMTPYHQSIAFGNETALMPSVIFSMPIIWSNAGNVSYPGHDNPDFITQLLQPNETFVSSPNSSVNRKRESKEWIWSRQVRNQTEVAWSNSSAKASHETPWRFQAIEAVFYLCVQTFNVTVVDGQAQSRMVGDSYSALNESKPVNASSTLPSTLATANDFLVAVDVSPDDRVYLRDPGNPTDSPRDAYSVSTETLITIAESLSNTGTAIVSDSGAGDEVVDEGFYTHTETGAGIIPSIVEAVYGQSRLSFNETDQMSRVQRAVNNIAVSLSNTYVAAPVSASA
jgi:hypothetical protein